MTEQPVWTETDSRDFLDLAEIAVPARAEQTRVLLDLIPAERGERFAVADICVGEGLLWELTLQAHPSSSGTALLERAGFSLVDCFWMHAGPAIYRGYC